ncbi:MAG: carboxypeptidase-like regulatory domain-containing protein [Prevotellaceae bacterium]|jgi:hypothetical protein|nr:carboxypeptidase-like regulatory domain-containing protein [Prevotellaceae bacterium]
MKKLVFNILFGFICPWLCGQTISGTVFDAKTREPIPGVVVYLNGTTLCTTSDNEGRFLLMAGTVMNTSLIISHLSYELLTIDKPFEYAIKDFLLKEKVNSISEARVTADRYSREAKMMIFKEQLLGTSKAGKSCVIINEEDIVLHFDTETNSLIGSAIQPIIFENKYLGYRVTFDMHTFCVKFSQYTLDMDKAISISFFGTSSFVDQNPYNYLYAKRREETFLTSIQYFWKSLISNTLNESNITIYNRFKKINQNQYFTILENTTPKKLFLIPDTNIVRKHSSVKESDIFGVIDVLFSRRHRSEIVFLTNIVSVDSYGNPSPVDKLIYFGVYGTQRLGDMLPQDYVYVKTIVAK